MAPKAKAPDGIEVLDVNFSDPHWRRDIDMERLLGDESLTFDYIKVDGTKFDQYFDRSDVSGQDQIRSTGSVGTIVESYKEALLLGEKLPTGTVSMTLQPVDFYHRGKAAKEAGIDYYVLIRITTDIAPWQRSIIATLRNNKHGLRMTDKDTMAQALLAVEHGWTAEETARKFRIDVSTLRRAMAVRQTEERARKLGVEPKFGVLKRTVQNELANAALHDGPFKGVVSLLAENPVTTTKAADIIRDVKGQASDRAAAARIKEIRDELAPTTLPTLGGGNDDTSTVTQRRGGEVVTIKGAAKAFLEAWSEFKVVLNDAPTLTALLAIAPADAAHARVSKAVEELREPVEKLTAHFG